MTGRRLERSTRAAKYVRDGMSYREAAKKAGVALSTCQRACKADGVVSRNAVGRPANKAKKGGA
jgi:transposase